MKAEPFTFKKDVMAHYHLTGLSLPPFLPGGTLRELALWKSEGTIYKLLPESLDV